jgi:hypothetical protein
LVACNIAPFFEIIEALESDGTLNEDAKLASLYEQLELTISQSSFPSPRGNIDEVDVTEADIRTFFEFGGSIPELSRTQAYLTKYVDPDPVSQPYVQGSASTDPPDPASGIEPGGGYDLDGKKLILLMDGHTSLSDSDFASGANLPVAGNVEITFAATVSGGTLTLVEVVTQINALLPGVASKVESAPSSGKYVLRLTSTKFGPQASVVVRWNGATANTGANRLGFDGTEDTIAVGSGFYAADDGDGDLTSPNLKIYAGSQQVVQSGFPGTVQTTATATFLDDNIEAGDTVYADGVSIGDVSVAASDTLTMEVEQNLISHSSKFSPRRVWVRANGLVYPAPAASAAAIQTGTVQTAAETVAYVVSQNPSMQSAVGAGESFDVNVVIDGVAQSTVTITSGAGWADLTAAVAGINAAATTFEAYFANEYGEELTTQYETDNPTVVHLGLRTLATNTGSGAGITIVSSSVATVLGFTSLPLGDVGENIRFRKGTWAVMTTSGVISSGFAGTETIAYQVDRGGVGITPTESFTLGVTADEDTSVAEWNDNARNTEAYRSTSTGVPSATGTYLSVRTRGENVGLTNGAAIDLTVDGGALFGVAQYDGTDTDLDGTTFKWSLDNNPHVYEVIFGKDEDDDGVSLQHVLDTINAVTPNIAAATSDSPPFLEMESNKVGEASEVEILDGTGNTSLGFTTDTATVGDGRPAPDMAIDVNGNLVLQSQLLFDGLTAIPYDPGSAAIVVAYKGLRLDMSPDAANPALLRFVDTDAVEDAADPVSTDNPGALMAYLSLLNAPTVEVTGIGVGEISADAPEGTPLGYAKCAEFLESEEVYALATASQIATVHQTFMTHVNAMSEPEQKGERIYFFNPVIPSRDNPDLVGSGTDANSTVTENELTVDVNLAPALIAAGIDPNLDINPTSGAIINEVYIDLASDDKLYLIQKVDNGTTITLRTTFVAGDGNDDSFYSTTVRPTLISDDWTVYIRGDELVQPGTTDPDRTAIAETIQTAAAAYGFRRAFWVHPDQCVINVTGLEQTVPGYYATACVVGMVSQLPPQQGFTNYPITGLTRVIGSNDQYTETQLSVMAGGGVYILVQDSQNAPVLCRHQLSTDTSTVETRELSITKVVDYTAKFLRAGLRSFIGRSNITQPFLDKLSLVTTGLLSFLYDSPGGVLVGAEINNLIQDADNPDTVLADVTLDVPYPCNFIRLTLII